MKTAVVGVVVLMLASVCCVSAQQFSSGWIYNPYAFYPFTNVQPPVQDTPEVAAARAAHLTAHANVRAGRVQPQQQQPQQQYRPQATIRTVPVSISSNNIVQDTPEVWAAKVEHYRAHQAAAAANGRISSLPPLVPYNYGLPQQVQDTPEVQAARAEFFRAFNAAAARSG